MSDKSGGGPAFPTVVDQAPELFSGMSLRDYFAAAALKEMRVAISENPGYWSIVARSAYACADEMLKAR